MELEGVRCLHHSFHVAHSGYRTRGWRKGQKNSSQSKDGYFGYRELCTTPRILFLDPLRPLRPAEGVSASDAQCAAAIAAVFTLAMRVNRELQRIVTPIPSWTNFSHRHWNNVVSVLLCHLRNSASEGHYGPLLLIKPDLP